MHIKKYPRRANWSLNLARLAGALSLTLGLIVLLGWYLHEPALIQVSPAFVPMQYNTALGFAVSGLALLGLAGFWPRLAGISSVIVLLIGVLTLIEYIFGIDLRIDQLFMEHYIDLKTSNPGRMAPNTALCFSLTGLTILLTTLYHDRTRITAWAATLGVLIISLGITALAGYMIGVEGAYGWGQMTRMAIHTAIGFMILGGGFIALAWSRSRLMSPGEILPQWVPQVIAITGLTITFALWQAMSAQEQRMVSEMGVSASNFSDEGLLAFGILLTFTLAFKARAMVKAAQTGRQIGRDYAPYVAIALGALLAASIYSLLEISFKSSVKQRFEAAVLNHAEDIEHGINMMLETLYHLRSSFDASSFLDRNEFRTLVSHSLKRNPGIKALEWVPVVSDVDRQAMEATARGELKQGFVIHDNDIPGNLTPALQRDLYFPIYYVEPLESFLPVLGFDLGSRQSYRESLVKSARGNIPVVSSRLQLTQSETGIYAVFIALPVYEKDMPLDSADDRETALHGFVVMVTEIGPLVEAILEKNSSPSGLTLTFSDAETSDEKTFMYRHVSRNTDLGPNNNGKDYLDNGLSYTTILAFADRSWQITAHAANEKMYPSWNINNLWLPLGVLLLSLGLAWFLYRIRQAAAETRSSMERFQILFERSSDAHMIVDDGGIIDCNDAAVHMLHYDDKQDLLSHHPADFSPEFQPDGRRSDEKTTEMDAIALSKGHHRFEWIHRKKDGETFPVEVSVTPVKLEEKTVLLALWHDLTEHKRVEEALRAAKEAADAANQAKSAFLANMSHELRTPMNAILGYSEMLMEEAEDLGQQDFIPDLKKINQAGNHLLALINDVLDLSKIESGKMEAFAEEINLDRLVDEVSAIAYPLMEKNNNTLSIERGKQLGCTYQDLTKLRQMLYNLLSNAAKFTHEGTVTLHINRSEQAGVEWLILAVSDTGIGIAANKLGHVFDEFTQADDSTTRDYGGTGLGLAITQRFCKLLGGELSVHSELGEGSTFTIRIPVILPGTQPQQPQAGTAAEKPEAGLEILRDTVSGSMILVIDDDPEACEIIERYLIKDGYSVVTATSGEQGLRLAHEIQPAIITLDVMMPDLDGWSVLRALKADPELRKIPVIMLTMIDDRSRGYSLGAVDYLTKPVDRELLRKALSRYYSANENSAVLLIEDDIEAREIMAHTLEKSGWAVSEAGNGQEALDVMVSIQPRLILLDLMMPVMDGFEFLSVLRARPEWQHIPVIVITAKDLTQEERVRLNGMTEEVVEKSAYTREQLLERVRDAVVACNISQANTSDA